MKCSRYSVLNTSKSSGYFRYLGCGQQLWINQKIQPEQLLVVDVVDSNISTADRNILINPYDNTNIPQIQTTTSPEVETTTNVTPTIEVTPTPKEESSQNQQLISVLIANSLWEGYLIGQTFSTIKIVNNSLINFVMKPNLDIQVGETVLLYYDNENQIIGEIQDYNDKTGSVVVQSSAIMGSGSYFIWKIYRV